MPAPGEMPHSEDYDVAKRLIDGDLVDEEEAPVHTPQDLNKYRNLENPKPDQESEQDQDTEFPEFRTENHQRLAAIVKAQRETIKQLQEENVEMIQHLSENDGILKTLVDQLVDKGVINTFVVHKKDLLRLEKIGYPTEKLFIVDDEDKS